MAGFSDRISRRLFLVELVLFAGPIVAMSAFCAVVLGGWSLFTVLAALSAPFWQDLPVDMTSVLTLVGIAGFFGALVWIAAAGCMALWSFVRVVNAFMTGGAAALRQHGRVFRRGLLFAVPAVAMMSLVAFTLVGMASVVDAVIAFYLSGLALLIPILHMALEMRLRTVSRENGG